MQPIMLPNSCRRRILLLFSEPMAADSEPVVGGWVVTQHSGRSAMYRTGSFKVLNTMMPCAVFVSAFSISMRSSANAPMVVLRSDPSLSTVDSSRVDVCDCRKEERLHKVTTIFL